MIHPRRAATAVGSAEERRRDASRRKPGVKRLLVALAFFAGACASSAPPRPPPESTVVGQEGGVRVEARLIFSNVSGSSAVSISADVQNLTAEPIGVAELVPMVDVSGDQATITVGSEVPGNQIVPRIVSIPPGMKKTFTGRVRIARRIDQMPAARVRLRVHYLSDLAPFAELLGDAEASKATAGSELADRLFTPWVERNVTIYTNDVPLPRLDPRRSREGQIDLRRH